MCKMGVRKWCSPHRNVLRIKLTHVYCLKEYLALSAQEMLGLVVFRLGNI